MPLFAHIPRITRSRAAHESTHPPKAEAPAIPCYWAHNLNVRYWWVNQNQTYRHEVRGNFLWSPKANANGVRNQFYDNMCLLEPGDVVFSFNNTLITALSVVQAKAQTGPKPNFGAAGMNWSQEGWYVPVEYCEFPKPIRPKDHIDILRPFLPPRYSPLQQTGNGLQGIYLTAIPEVLSSALIQLIGLEQYENALAAVTWLPPKNEAPENEQALLAQIGPTFREQLVRARRGQGVFRSNVLLVEEQCRVTKVSDRRHLIASHIKPWKDATDAERLNGQNGLLLSPHIDHLFDEGYATFSITEQLVVIPEVKADLLDKWGIDSGINVGHFSRDQQAFLDYHRAYRFKGARHL